MTLSAWAMRSWLNEEYAIFGGVLRRRYPDSIFHTSGHVSHALFSSAVELGRWQKVPKGSEYSNGHFRKNK